MNTSELFDDQPLTVEAYERKIRAADYEIHRLEQFLDPILSDPASKEHVKYHNGSDYPLIKQTATNKPINIGTELRYKQIGCYQVNMKGSISRHNVYYLGLYGATPKHDQFVDKIKQKISKIHVLHSKIFNWQARKRRLTPDFTRWPRKRK